MSCDRVRERMLAGEAAADADTARHLAQCPACSRFDRRLQGLRGELARHHAGLEPDPRFAARVLARLPGPAEALGWAALRLLPAALALVLALGWLGLSSSLPASTALLGAPGDELLLAYAALSGEVAEPSP